MAVDIGTLYIYGGGLNATLKWILTLKLFKSIENRSDYGRVDSIKILQTTNTYHIQSRNFIRHEYNGDDKPTLVTAP